LKIKADNFITSSLFFIFYYVPTYDLLFAALFKIWFILKLLTNKTS